MARGLKLSEREKGLIEGYGDRGYGIREIARKIGRSHNVVGNFLRNKTSYGTKKHPGRPSKLSSKDKRRIIRAASNSSISLKEIKKKNGLKVSRETIRRVIKSSPHIVRAKLKPAPYLKPAHLSARLHFARKNMQTDWSKVRILFLSCNYSFSCTSLYYSNFFGCR